MIASHLKLKSTIIIKQRLPEPYSRLGILFKSNKPTGQWNQIPVSVLKKDAHNN